MAGSKILRDDKTIVNVFRNMPVAAHGWHMGSAEAGTERGEACAVFNDAFYQTVGYTPREIETLFDGTENNNNNKNARRAEKNASGTANALY